MGGWTFFVVHLEEGGGMVRKRKEARRGGERKKGKKKNLDKTMQIFTEFLKVICDKSIALKRKIIKNVIKLSKHTHLNQNKRKLYFIYLSHTGII